MDEFLDLHKLADQLESQDKIIDIISDRLKYVLEQKPESFVNFLYRFDLAEELVAPHLHPPIDYKSIAQLIWNRQLQKMNNWK